MRDFYDVFHCIIGSKVTNMSGGHLKNTRFCNGVKLARGGCISNMANLLTPQKKCQLAKELTIQIVRSKIQTVIEKG